MIVRSFHLSDYYPVTQLLQEVLSEECCEETRQAFSRQLSLDSKLVLVASVEEEIVGLIIGTIDDNKGYYYRIAVHPDHRGKGVGKALINGLKERFIYRKVSRIVVSLDAHNEPVLPLYKALGYSASDFLKPLKPLRIVNG
ncbi:GNAT family N-acetyltransferase [Paenibacillus sp. J2TS4]|uniref:GNAT family N-acetyltransferase n=1 Tax=Paenibacillus sp. J2TS4 TaxID=2807194 RepID=UPI001B2143B7|nr:GNAT family N-acetyltransferase [Paenibacillus sp. J2TS4]GIP34740.1 N-acetyltransferase [Paenibacillus sp. J2TS4]